MCVRDTNVTIRGGGGGEEEVKWQTHSPTLAKFWMGISYSAFHALGFQLPALGAMQEANIQLGQAYWQSSSGFPISFF